MLSIPSLVQQLITSGVSLPGNGLCSWDQVVANGLGGRLWLSESVRLESVWPASPLSKSLTRACVYHQSCLGFYSLETDVVPFLTLWFPAAVYHFPPLPAPFAASRVMRGDG